MEDPRTILIIASAIAFGACMVLIYYYIRAKGKLDEMWAVDTYDARELKRMCSGGFDAIVEVQGNVSCDQPIKSLAAELDCCWFRTKVERQVLVTTKNGTRREWRTGFDQTHSTVFQVTDPTGYVFVDPHGSEIDSVEVMKREVFERETWFESVGFSDTGAYRITEDVFFHQGYSYVLGQALSLQSGAKSDVLIHYPKTGYLNPKRKLFVISRKTEKELVAYLEITSKVCFWLAIAAFFACAVCVLMLTGVIPAQLD